MSLAHEHSTDPTADQLTMQAALLEMGRPRRRAGHEITPQSLPYSFEFTQAALDYGYAQAERGVHIFRELERTPETRFTYRIDSSTGEFIVAEPASDAGASETRVIDMGNGVERYIHTPQEVSISEARAIAASRLRTLLHEFRIGNFFSVSQANLCAIEAHTHPPRLDIYRVPSELETTAERLLGPLNSSVPSHFDLLNITLKGRGPQLVFSPGGLSILVVPTDRTPTLTRQQRHEKLKAADHDISERTQLAHECTSAMLGEGIGSHLEAVLRNMYRDDPSAAGLSAGELLGRNLRYALSGDPHAALFNPVTYLAMQQIRPFIEDLGAVGYYNLQASGNVFSRFTSWAA